MAYQTRQKEALLACLEAAHGRALSVADITELLSRAGSPVGRTTVYRLLNELQRDGRLRRFRDPGSRSAKFEFIPAQSDTFDFRCNRCQKIFHLKCSAFSALQAQLREHLTDRHGFALESGQSLFRGLCPECNRLPDKSADHS